MSKSRNIALKEEEEKKKRVVLHYQIQRDIHTKGQCSVTSAEYLSFHQIEGMRL